ncbi:MAG: DUF364 domain-containing protein [Anaerolineales bacterium]|nr:DUF364 domain-containing protein [Anaerolineales bacterium]
MSALEDLISASAAVGDPPVQGVQVGLYWTAVRVGGAEGAIGLASTIQDASCCQAVELAGAGTLQQQSAQGLAARLLAPRPLEAGLGLATVNALLAPRAGSGVQVNALNVLIERGRGKHVALIGHFNFTDKLRVSAGRLSVLELEPGPGDLPAAAAPDVLPGADVIGLTSSTLVNHTFDDLARLFPANAVVVMIGPSTPLSPVLFDYGVSVLAGSVIDDPEFVWHAVGQGSALHDKRTGLQRVTLVRDPVI